MVATLRNRYFALIWTAGLLSMLGDWALFAPFPDFVLQQPGSVFGAGLVWAIIAIPGVIIGPMAGVYVDRGDRKAVMFWVNLLQAAVIAALVFAVRTNRTEVVYAVPLAEASLVCFSSPAESALLPTVVGNENLIAANALNGLNDNLARIGGPVIGAVVLARFGMAGVGLIDVDPEGFGTLLSFRRLASIIGGLLIARFALSVTPARLAGWAFLVVGGGVLTISASRSFAVACLVTVAMGPALAAGQTGLTTWLQQGTTDAVRGRVFALVGAVSGSVSIAGALLGSTLGEAFGPALVITVCGGLYLLAGATGLLLLARAAPQHHTTR